MPKTATLSRSSTGKGSVCFSCCSCECAEPSPLLQIWQPVGIAVGVKTFATRSTGQELATPRFFPAEEQPLAKVQRRLSPEDKGTRERARRRSIVARVQERRAWRRSDFTQQHRRQSVDAGELIAGADVSVNRMTHHHGLANSMQDAAWSQFTDLLSYRAAWAGRRDVAVNPAYTSQDCSQCGHRQALSLYDRISTGPCSGIVLDLD